MNEETIFIENEQGKKECNIITAFELKNKKYIALLPIGEDEILLFSYIELEEEAIEIFNIEDENEFDEVLTYFDNLIE